MNESKYILKTPIDHRKDYGQFFTPPIVAHMMAEWVMKDGPVTILDPAFGLGVFYDEVIKLDTGKQVQFIGYEIDENILAYRGHDGDKSNIKIINTDYLEAEIGTFDGIICNPPYMRFQKFLQRHNVLRQIEEKLGKKLVGYSNIASVFLVKSLQELSKNGRLSFIMPFEFFNTGYGKEIKGSLLENHLLKQIILFSNEKDIFPDATTTVCILLCKNDGKEEDIKITTIQNKKEMDEISDISNFYQRKIKTSDLPYDKKWSPIILSLFTGQKVPEGFCKVSMYGAFYRGIATGANEFFALNKSKIDGLNLSKENICKCITKSAQIRKFIFTEDDYNELHNGDKPVHCLDVKKPNDTSVINYIKRGEELGLNNRYLTSNRSPWYKIERRKIAPILFGVFSRGRLKVIRNYSSAINFTCFHSFYPNIFGENNVNKLFIYFLSDIGQSTIRINKRTYGSNLEKFEPGDLNDCSCPNQRQLAMISEDEAEKVIEVAKENENLAIQMSNELINRIMNEQG